MTMKPKERLHKAFKALVRDAGSECMTRYNLSPALKEMLAAIEALPDVGNEEVLAAINRLAAPVVSVSEIQARPELPDRKPL